MKKEYTLIELKKGLNIITPLLNLQWKIKSNIIGNLKKFFKQRIINQIN